MSLEIKYWNEADKRWLDRVAGKENLIAANGGRHLKQSLTGRLQNWNNELAIPIDHVGEAKVCVFLMQN